jgi:hypothetical protein
VVAKTGIIDELGEPALLRPGQVNEALAANDRLKYRFTLLQAAHAHALERDAPCPDLRVEREAAGVDDAELDGVVATSRLEDGQCVLPGAARIHDAIEADLRTMRVPLAADEGGQVFEQRLAQMLAAPRPRDDRLPAGYVGAITHARLQREKSLLEGEFGDLQDFEFTVQDGELFLLQTRDGKRTPWAALHVAVD